MSPRTTVASLHGELCGGCEFKELMRDAISDDGRARHLTPHKPQVTTSLAPRAQHGGGDV